MNKIKLLYDVVRTMKAKSVLKGALKVGVEKDHAKIFSIQNEFEKNISTGHIKSKINAEVDYEGKMAAHEQYGRLRMGREQHGLQRHISRFHGCGHERIAEKFAKWAFALGLLDALKIEEQEDKSIIILLDVNDISTDMKLLFQEKMRQANERHHCGSLLMSELCDLDKFDLVIKLYINKNYEVENILLIADGNQTDQQTKQYNLKARAELSFLW